MNDRKPTVAVLAQQLDDHLAGCEAGSQATNRRLGRIEGILIAVAGSAILQLVALVIALMAFIFMQGYPIHHG